MYLRESLNGSSMKRWKGWVYFEGKFNEIMERLDVFEEEFNEKMERKD